jgi:hypothetical protein
VHCRVLARETSANVSKCQHTSAYVSTWLLGEAAPECSADCIAECSREMPISDSAAFSSPRRLQLMVIQTRAYPPEPIRQHTSAYASIRQHTPAYVSIRKRTSAGDADARIPAGAYTSAYVSIRQHTPAYASIWQHMAAYVSR